MQCNLVLGTGTCTQMNDNGAKTQWDAGSNIFFTNGLAMSYFTYLSYVPILQDQRQAAKRQKYGVWKVLWFFCTLKAQTVAPTVLPEQNRANSVNTGLI